MQFHGYQELSTTADDRVYSVRVTEKDFSSHGWPWRQVGGGEFNPQYLPWPRHWYNVVLTGRRRGSWQETETTTTSEITRVTFSTRLSQLVSLTFSLPQITQSESTPWENAVGHCAACPQTCSRVYPEFSFFWGGGWFGFIGLKFVNAYVCTYTSIDLPPTPKYSKK